MPKEAIHSPQQSKSHALFNFINTTPAHISTRPTTLCQVKGAGVTPQPTQAVDERRDAQLRNQDGGNGQ